MTSSAMKYLYNRIIKEGDKVERAQLVEMKIAWESKEVEAERLNTK